MNHASTSSWHRFTAGALSDAKVLPAPPVLAALPPLNEQPLAAAADDRPDGDGDTVVVTTVETLVGLLDPIHGDPWGVGLIRGEVVHAALQDGRLRPTNPCWADTAADDNDHAERIAWLIHHGWDRAEPLHLDVDQHGGATLNDGNHRLYALAWMEASGDVRVAVSGFLDEAEVALGVTIP